MEGMKRVKPGQPNNPHQTTRQGAIGSFLYAAGTFGTSLYCGISGPCFTLSQFYHMVTHDRAGNPLVPGLSILGMVFQLLAYHNRFSFFALSGSNRDHCGGGCPRRITDRIGTRFSFSREVSAE